MWVARFLARHPRVAMAVRSSLAAVIAWYVARFLPDPASDFPYYAPMGAVIATSMTLAGSARESVQAVASIVLGGGIALGAQLLGPPGNPLVIAAAVALGVMAGGWTRLGAMGLWVPTSAIFTLVIGDGDAFYVGVYAGLVVLGALIGLGVTAIMPQLPLAPAQDAIRRVRRILVEQLNELADALEQDELPDRKQWEQNRRRATPHLAAMRTEVFQAEESARANFRAHRHRGALETLRKQDDALENAAALVVEITTVLAQQENRHREIPALGPLLRPDTAEVIRHLASTIDSVTGTAADPAHVSNTRHLLDGLTRRLDENRRTDRPGGGTLAAGTLVIAVSRCLDAIDPGHLEPPAAASWGGDR